VPWACRPGPDRGVGVLQRLELRQGQSLVMTPQLLQAIKLLQLSHLDLAAYVDAELERNPLLERGEGADAADDARFEEDGPEPKELPSASVFQDGEGESGAWLDCAFPDDLPPVQPAGGGEGLTLQPSSWSNIGPGGHFDGDAPDFGDRLVADLTLHEHLQAQLDLATADPTERLIGRFLIDAIDDAGYLTESVEAIADRLAASPAQVERVLALLHAFEPSGVGARSLAECLTLQLKERNRFDPCMRALLDRLDLVAKRDLLALKRLCGVDDEDLAEMLADLRALDPKPGRGFGAAPVQVLIPDVFVRQAPDGSWLVELNPDALPRVLVNQTYYARVSGRTASDADRTFLSECLQSANWLTRSLEQRAKTILKVASEIVCQQDGFFRRGVSQLRPLNLRTVADAIGMHESTVSRVTSNKAIATVRGTFEMKYFFTAAIPGSGGAEAHSSEAVRHRIKQLIDAEPPGDVLSDDALVQKLKDEGVDIARRTIAKYRESLRIPSSIERRRESAAGFAR
jgi:RNA polymerase sigma-54 factor